jgi:assimilatory nitrate reductase catalytic subunit
MGTRESGFTSSIPGYRNFALESDRADYARIANVPKERVPTARGYKYGEIIEAIESGEIKALWVVATNPLVSFVNQNRLKKALEKLELLVVQDAFMSDTAQLADVVLSASTWGEKKGTYTNSERRCNIAQIATTPVGESKPDFNIFLDIAQKLNLTQMLYPNWNKPEDAFNEWREVSRGRLCDYSGMSYDKIIHAGGIQWPCNESAPQGTKRLYSSKMKFNTKIGKANLIFTAWLPMDEPLSKHFPIMMNTGRTVEQFHTRTKTGEINILNDLAPKAWIDINPVDAQKLEVKSGDALAISSIRGRIEGVTVRVTQSVAPCSIFVPFHFNTEMVNDLTASCFDPISGEPNYKQTAVQLHSIKYPKGIVMTPSEIAGVLTNQTQINQPDTLREITKSHYNSSK